MMHSRSLVAAVAALAVVLGCARIAVAKTFSFPHVLEVSGSITAGELDGQLIPRGVNLTKGSVPKTLVAADTEIEITYYGGLPGAAGTGLTSATVNLYLYDQTTGDLIKRSDGQNACGPCVATLSSSNRKQSYRLDDFITVAGSPPTQKVITGYAIVTVSNDDANVNMVMHTTVNIGKKLDLAVFTFEPQELQAPAP